MKRFSQKAALHECCPPEWRNTPLVTGDYDFDESLRRSKNPEMHKRLQSHIAGGGPGYGPLTGYDGYSNYSGDI